MWESFCGDEEWRYESVRTQHFSGWVLKLCVLFCCGHSELLTGNTGPIVEFIVGTLCLWASSPSPARYVGDGGMWVMSSVSFSAERQRKVKMQKCQSPPARSLCARCSVASPSRSSSSRQELRGRWLGGRRPLLVLIQRSLAVREEDGEHGFIPTSRLRLQRQVCRSELTTTDMHWTDLNVRTAHMTFCTPEREAFLSSCPRGVVCREGWIRSWSCGWGGLHPGLRGCSHRAGTEPSLPHISTWTGSAHNAPVLLVLVHQIYSNREVEEAMTKIRDVLSDDKRDWELRVAAVRLPACRLCSVISEVRMFVDRLLSSCPPSLRRCAHCCWPAPQSSTGFRSSCVSWRRRSNCPPKTCARRWWGRPASLWGETQRSQEKPMIQSNKLSESIISVCCSLQPPVVGARQPLRPRGGGHHAHPPQPGPQQCQSHGHLRHGRHPPHPQSA